MPNALKIFSYEKAPTLVFYTRILKRKKNLSSYIKSLEPK